MSENTQNAKGEPILAKVKQRLKKTVRVVSQLLGRASYPTRVAQGLLYTLARTGKPRLKVARAVGLPGLIKFVVEKLQDSFTRGIHVPVIHLRNEQDRDDRGQRAPIGMKIIRAAYLAGMVILGGKHMYDRRLLPLFARTFPKAVDGAAYIRGLGSPTIGNGTFEDLPVVMKDITSTNAKGEVIHAGADGSGRIHPAHPVFERIGGACPIQIRMWHPLHGVFIKGILVPDDRCVDDEGRPTIWVDWLQIKGKHKDLAKAKCGLKTGAFDPVTGVLVKPELLEESLVGEGYFMGILQRWDRKGTIKWCFEILERVEDNNANRKRVVSFVSKALQELEDKGGLYGILADKSEDDQKLQLIIQFAEKLSERLGVFVDPLKVPFVWDFVQDELQRKLYHLRQGAGKRSLRYVAVLDNGVPPGHVVMRHLHDGGEWRFHHGSEVAVTRFPMILPQALKVLKVIDARKCGHLSHLLTKTEKGLVVAPWVAYFNEADLVDGMQGDDDGDTVLVDYDPEVVEMFKSRIALIPGTESDTFLIEPGKVAESWKSAVQLCEKIQDAVDGSFKVGNGDFIVSPEALKILGTDGRGPVGQLTYYCSLFLALNMRMHALACAVLIQEAIDAAKHIILNSDPAKLADVRNWVKDAEGRWEPIGCKAEVDGPWNDSNGHLNMEKFASWVSHCTGKTKMSDVLTWRPVSGEKKIRDGEVMRPSVRGSNLVHFCAATMDTLWAAWKKDNIKESPTVELADLLPQALGMSVKSANPESRSYKDLMTKSGLPKFGANVRSIRNEGLEPEERNAKIEAEQDLLVQTLRGLSKVELLTIWVTEHTVAKFKPEGRKTNVNRAFRAVTFEGSPILNELGIEMTYPCQYLAGGGLDAFFEKLQETVSQCEEQDILHAVVHWANHAEDHAELVGTPADECDHCRDLLRSKVVNHIRTSREGKGKEFTSRVADVCNTMNNFMQEKGN